MALDAFEKKGPSAAGALAHPVGDLGNLPLRVNPDLHPEQFAALLQLADEIPQIHGGHLPPENVAKPSRLSIMEFRL